MHRVDEVSAATQKSTIVPIVEYKTWCKMYISECIMQVYHWNQAK